jgi:hypothetical protein
MTTLSSYGQAIASTTVALQQLLSAAPAKLQVTARTPDAARDGISGASVNLLLSAYPGDASDADAVSHRAFGTARAVVQQNPVLSVPLADGPTNVQLRSQTIGTEHVSSLWIASSAPLRLSFGIVATFTVSG